MPARAAPAPLELLTRRRKGREVESAVRLGVKVKRRKENKIKEEEVGSAGGVHVG
jgi:hypothetical protein